ncbi:DUF3105 domain-containing protein [Trujillonella endophytica]|uniref:DUF3105 domain-containing protein n=1 Tax=Trujillonella endophytica TaxID=673521 RepID=A0A1H8TKY8_9ACTN|nr:DUF3105 domain-containing protein [Trujillella endophytica]SEO91456.1 Protein of unknown function [Trujillella endophytica]
MPKDGKPDEPRNARGASGRGSSASSGRDGSAASGRGGSRPAGKGGAGKGPAAKGGRTRPTANVVSPQRPWGLIAAAIAVVVFAGAVLTYAVLQVRESEANEAGDPGDIAGVQTYEYAAGQEHVTSVVDYAESPPVGGPHEPAPGWADCTGTVYDVDIRHENAVHSLEHGAVWITYDPEVLSEDDVSTLADLVDGENGRMMSPYVGLDAPISIQSWNHQLKVDSVDDERLEQFADLLTLNGDYYPEVGASCQNPDFIASPRLAAEDAAPTAEGGAAETEAAAG